MSRQRLMFAEHVPIRFKADAPIHEAIIPFIRAAHSYPQLKVLVDEGL